jgi:hypothetical protein
MSDTKEVINTSSAQFNEGVEAGLNSTEDTRNWKAGNELGQELKDESESKEQVSEELLKDSSVPLFMKVSVGGNKGNAQDEKDETEE